MTEQQLANQSHHVMHLSDIKTILHVLGDEEEDNCVDIHFFLDGRIEFHQSESDEIVFTVVSRDATVSYIPNVVHEISHANLCIVNSIDARLLHKICHPDCNYLTFSNSSMVATYSSSSNIQQSSLKRLTLKWNGKCTLNYDKFTCHSSTLRAYLDHILRVAIHTRQYITILESDIRVIFKLIDSSQSACVMHKLSINHGK